ncbi:hypothetical protein B9Z55_028742 [Caenorhabditis nigoni]|uniref:Uncharacterized protein n=1 Tax=Caenorhabditis nigoni TaxID=1611254 RepID=A0A2G5SA54_9PELO|nr:hypothetical protein B9Z55_028742 [Caenorhabditis nigoni]
MWQHLGRDLVNLRLRRRGSVAVRFCHRPSHGLTGTLQLSRLTAHTCVFYWREEEQTISVYEYFFAKYGFELQYPNDFVDYFGFFSMALFLDLSSSAVFRLIVIMWIFASDFLSAVVLRTVAISIQLL